MDKERHHRGHRADRRRGDGVDPAKPVSFAEVELTDQIMRNERRNERNDDRDDDALDDVSASLLCSISFVMPTGLGQDDGRSIPRGFIVVKSEPVSYKRIASAPDVVPRQMEIELERVKRAAMIRGLDQDLQNIFGITR